MGPNQSAADIDDMNRVLASAFGSSDSRDIDWNGNEPDEIELDESDIHFIDNPYESRA